MSFVDFKTKIEAAGLQARECSRIHWQVIGAFVVNCYPFAKGGPTIHVSKTNAGRKCDRGQLAKLAIEAARKAPPMAAQQDRTERSSKSTRRIRRRLHRSQGDKCCWCEEPLTLETSTLDHIVPLARGGTNGTDNFCLACEGCNHDRGHDMPEIKRGGER